MHNKDNIDTGGRKLAFGYIRQDGEEGTISRQGSSIALQQAQICAMANARNLFLGGILIDTGFSGGGTKRASYRALMTLGIINQIDYWLVASEDRISADPAIRAEIYSWLANVDMYVLTAASVPEINATIEHSGLVDASQPPGASQ